MSLVVRLGLKPTPSPKPKAPSTLSPARLKRHPTYEGTSSAPCRCQLTTPHNYHTLQHAWLTPCSIGVAATTVALATVGAFKSDQAEDHHMTIIFAILVNHHHHHHHHHHHERQRRHHPNIPTVEET